MAEKPNASTSVGLNGKPEGWTSDHWATPWPIVQSLEAEFGRFDVDVAATSENAKVANYYTVEEDGLTQPWFGRVWLNPPFSNVTPWLERAIASVGESRGASLVAVLLPCATDTRWFHELVLPFAEIRFLRGRVRFIGWEGTPIPAPKAPSLLAIYRRAALREVAS